MKKKIFLTVLCIAACLMLFACGKTTISLNKTQHTMDVGETLQLTATVKKSTAAIEWKSSNPAVATVSTDGLVTAVKKGVTVVSAKVNDVVATSQITVTDLQGDLQQSKNSAISELETLVSGKSATHTVVWEEIKAAETRGKTAISSATSISAVSSELTKAKTEINTFKSDIVISTELESAKTTKLALIPSLVGYEENMYTIESWQAVRTAIEEDVAAITAATTISEVASYEITADLTNLITKEAALAAAKATAIASIESSIETTLADYAQFSFHLEAVRTEFIEKVGLAINIEDVNLILTEALGVSGNFNLISANVETTEELVSALQSDAIVYIYINEGEYDLTDRMTTIHVGVNARKIIIGEGMEKVTVLTNTNVEDSASIIIYNSIHMSGISFIGTGTNENSGGRPVIKVSMFPDLTQESTRRLVKEVTFEDISITTTEGTNARGLSLHGVENAVLRNVTVEMDTTKGGVALTLAWVNVEIFNSNIGNGTWGSIGVMYASDNVDYQGDVSVTIDESTEISSHVYAESFEEYNISIIGLDWEELTTDTGTKVYLNPKLSI